MASVAVLFLIIVAAHNANAGVFVHFQAVHANGGARGGGERVIAYDSGSNSVKLSDYKPDNDKIIWEKVESATSNTFYFYFHHNLNKRLAISGGSGGKFTLSLQPKADNDVKQDFVLLKGAIYCYGGKKHTDGRKYVIKYDQDKIGGAIICGIQHDMDNEKFTLVSTKPFKLDKAQVFIINKHSPYTKLATKGSKEVTYVNSGFEARTLFRLRKGTAQHDRNYYYIESGLDNNKRIVINKWKRIFLYWGQHYLDQAWKLNLVEDNLGQDWDYYVLRNVGRERSLFFKNNRVQSYSGTHPYDDQKWRLVPRFTAEDEGYQMVARHRGNPTDITETITFTQGLTLTKSTEVSVTVGMTASIEKAVTQGPFSATATLEMTTEISTVNTAGSEQSWSKEVNIERTFPANKDCTLYQRKVEYLSPIVSDGLSQTPRDFKMVCT